MTPSAAMSGISRSLVLSEDDRLRLELLAEAGIPNTDVLEGATRVAARVLRRSADLGTIQPGKWADLIVVDGDPLTDITALTRIRTVYLAGRAIPSAQSHRPHGVTRP